MAAIDVRGVTKRYGGVTALRDLDLTVEEGEIYGFLGPNGAGKSTTIDVLLDFTRPTSGSASVLGMDAQASPVAIHERIGVLPDGFGTIGRMTGRQHVRFAIEAKGADDDPAALLERVRIAGAADRVAADYSKGMAQRLVLATALVGDPDLLILDEPSTGLDPNGARRMRDIVREEADRGATVFFSSHILEQVEAVCDRVGILRDGELVAEDTIEGLRADTGGRAEFSVTLDRPADAAADRVRALEGVGAVRVEGDTLTATCEARAKAAVVDAAREDGATALDIRSEETSLDDLFATYTGETGSGVGETAPAGGESGSGTGEADPADGEAGSGTGGAPADGEGSP